MSQQELAEAVGYKGKSMISQVENGSVDLPESMILKFADALHTTPSYLMGWDDSSEISDSMDGIDIPPGTDPERVKEAMRFLARYENASPEIQAAILTLLRAHQSEQ